MAVIVNDRFLDCFTIKWPSEIGSYAGYRSFTNATTARSIGFYIGGGEHYCPYPDFDPVV